MDGEEIGRKVAGISDCDSRSQWPGTGPAETRIHSAELAHDHIHSQRQR
jgi:hypothetical protein